MSSFLSCVVWNLDAYLPRATRIHDRHSSELSTETEKKPGWTREPVSFSVSENEASEENENELVDSTDSNIETVDEADNSHSSSWHGLEPVSVELGLS